MSEQDGVLGNLPRTRPGVASPRRSSARAKAAAKGAKRREPAGESREATAGPAEPAEEARHASGFEELARAGAGLATVIVVVGAQLTGRVLGEMAKAVGRR